MTEPKREIWLETTREDLLEGYIRVHVGDGDIERVYRIEAHDLKAIYESMQRNVIDSILSAAYD